MIERNFERFTDAELARAIELMITPDDLKSRTLMIAILKAADFSAREVREQIMSNEQLFNGRAVRWSF